MAIWAEMGAASVFTRSGGVWTQQGGKLVGTGAVGNAHHGSSVALSADGNTAIVGGPEDNTFTGAAWVYTRNGGVWTQQGGKLLANDSVGPLVFQGMSVALALTRANCLPSLTSAQDINGCGGGSSPHLPAVAPGHLTLQLRAGFLRSRSSRSWTAWRHRLRRLRR